VTVVRSSVIAFGAHRDDFDAARDRVTGAHRRFERPIDVQGHRTQPRQLFAHNGIQDRARHSALDDDLPEAGRLGRGFVVVQRVAVTADLREQGFARLPDVGLHRAGGVRSGVLRGNGGPVVGSGDWKRWRRRWVNRDS